MHRAARQLLDDRTEIARAADELVTGLNRYPLRVLGRQRTLQQLFVVGALRSAASDLADLFENGAHSTLRSQPRDPLGNVDPCFSQYLRQETREPFLHWLVKRDTAAVEGCSVAQRPVTNWHGGNRSITRGSLFAESCEAARRELRQMCLVRREFHRTDDGRLRAARAVAGHVLDYRIAIRVADVDVCRRSVRAA